MKSFYKLCSSFLHREYTLYFFLAFPILVILFFSKQAFYQKNFFSILFQIIFPFRLLQNIEQSSLCYTVSFCWLSILNIAAYTCQFQTPSVFLPSPSFPSGNPKAQRIYTLNAEMKCYLLGVTFSKLQKQNEVLTPP